VACGVLADDVGVVGSARGTGNGGVASAGTGNCCFYALLINGHLVYFC
jgi:hypothetical protein